MRKLILIFTLASSFCWAHEGHDHGPGQVPLQKGGVMRSLETVHLELVFKDNAVKIYPFETAIDQKSSQLKSADPTDFRSRPH